MYYQDSAIILKRKDFKDNDSLITCYTEKHGKLILRAIGAKKILSKLSSHLEPISLSELNWVAGKGGEKLTGANSLFVFKNIKQDYYKLNFAQYFLDIIDKAIKTHHPDLKIFLFLKSVLQKLDSIPVDKNFSVETRHRLVSDKKTLYLIKLAFDYKLLFLLGHSPEYRKELSVAEKSAIKKIINLKIDEIIKLNLDKKILNSLYKKSSLFWEEIIEEEIRVLKI